jgi:hypothetical protein
MESNVRRTLLIIFAALVILLLPWSFIPVARIWSGVAEDTKKADQDEGFNNILRRLDIVYMAKSVQTPSPTERAKTFRDDAESQRQAVIDQIVNNDKAFEAFFLTGEDKPADDMEKFKNIYEQYIPGENGLAELPRKQGIFTVTGTTPPQATDLVAKTATISDEYERRALQKKVWIYQRVIYSLLKNAPSELKNAPSEPQDAPPERKRLIVSLEPPSGTGTGRFAIVIENCEAKNEQDKGTFATASKEPLFYGDKIPEITVKFTVVMDERHIPELLEELAVYNPHNAPIIDTQPNKTPIPGLGEVKPISLIVQRMAIRRFGPPKNPFAPQEPGKNVIEAPAEPELSALRPWVKVEFTFRALDYNPDSGKSPSK